MKKIILFFFVFSLLSYLHAQNFEIKVACVGNSITEGFGRENGDSYPNQLDVLLGDKYDVRNFGVGGRTMLKNGDFPYWNELQFEMAQDFDPDIVIILLGTNDSKPQNWLYKDEYYFDYVDMVNVFRDLDSEPEIFVSFPPPVFQTGWGINDSIIHFEIIPLVDSVRTSQNTFHINFYNTMTEMSGLFPDGIHPNAEGYGEMARIAAEAIINRPSGVIHYFYTDSETIEEDEDATLYWQASDSSVVTLDNQTVKINDSLTVSPLQTTEYTLITNGEFQDTSMVLITFLPSGLIKSFYGNPHILEKNTGDSSVVFWETTNNSQSFLAGIQVAQKDSMIMTPYETTSYTLVAEGTVKDTSLIMIEVLDADEINRSLLASSFSASSTEFKYSVESAFDSDTTSYWLSEGHSAEWIAVDLGQEIFINRIVINWGDVCAKSYRIEVIDEQNNLSVFSFISDGHGGIDDIGGDAIKGKQVRILCLTSSSDEQGYKIKEFEIYGTAIDPSTSLNRESNIPARFELNQNYPNPFNPLTVISYQLPVVSKVDLSIYNLLGQKVHSLVSEKQTPGNYSVQWDASRQGGIASGVYFYKLSTDQNWSRVKKVVFLK